MNTFDFLGNPLLGSNFKSKAHLDYAPQKSIYDLLCMQEGTIAVVGLGYVGLPIALEFARDFNVIGFDINEQRIEMMKNGEDPSRELEKTSFENRNISFTSVEDSLIDADVYIVAVPTPVNKDHMPDLTPVISACKTIGKTLGRGDIVVFESTVYPGCTEDDCIPILEQISGLKLNIDFKVGYSPERINPGDKKNTLSSITKIVSGSDQESAEEIYKIYNHIIDAGIHLAPSIKVAEAAKIVENTQRDINIAFMNELSVLFDHIGINTHDVLAAAGTKWNFLNFYPGLVGGHCIGVDPYYLIHKAEEMGLKLPMISSGRKINDHMPRQVVERLREATADLGQALESSKALILGTSFKENVSDLRNSKAAELAQLLQQECQEIHVVDPRACAQELEKYYDLQLTEQLDRDYDIIVYAVNHDEFDPIDWAMINSITKDEAVIFDFKKSLGKPHSILQQFTYLTL